MEDEKLVNSIVKAIAHTENGGAPDIEHPKKGKTGEMKSIYQFTPATWKKDSIKYFGKETPITPDTETYVAQQKVSHWIKKGYTARQIASVWNAGEGEPDAHTGKFSNGTSSVGINKKYGVKFDVPGYADKVEKYANEFYGEIPKAESAPKAQVPQQQEHSPITVGPITSSGVMNGSSNGSIPTTKKPLLTRSGGLLRGQFSYNEANKKP